MLELWPVGPCKDQLSARGYAAGKRAAPRESVGSRGGQLSCFTKVVAVPAEDPLWVVLKLKSGNIPALVDTGAQFSCMRTEVAEYLRQVGEPCVFEPCLVGCILAEGTRCDVTNSVRLQVKLSDFTWKHEFNPL